MPGDYGNVNFYFWVPIVRPLIGGAIAAFVYDLGIRDFLSSAGS
jgi:glycerol uptake facilitator protein